VREQQLREWAAEQRLESAPVRVELALRRALRARRWRRRMAWAAPVAAAATLVFVFWTVHEPAAGPGELPRVSSPAPTLAVTPHGLPSLAKAMPPSDASEKPAHNGLASARQEGRVPRPLVPCLRGLCAAEGKPAPARRARRRPAPQPFVPVGAWQAVEPLERASIVRAVLPRAALVGYGVAIDSGSWTEPAQVELLLGEDRTVRAIRPAAPVQ